VRLECAEKKSQAIKKLDVREDIQLFMLPEKPIWWVV